MGRAGRGEQGSLTGFHVLHFARVPRPDVLVELPCSEEHCRGRQRQGDRTQTRTCLRGQRGSKPKRSTQRVTAQRVRAKSRYADAARPKDAGRAKWAGLGAASRQGLLTGAHVLHFARVPHPNVLVEVRSFGEHCQGHQPQCGHTRTRLRVRGAQC